MKKVLITILILILVLTQASICLAESSESVGTAFKSGDVWYEVTDNDDNYVKVIAGKDGEYVGDITVPETVESEAGVEYTVNELGDECFEFCSSLTSVDLPDTITKVGTYCFWATDNLATLNFDMSNVETVGYFGLSKAPLITINLDSIEEIDSSAFWACEKLKSVTCGKDLEILGERAFWSCGKLSTITFNSKSMPEIGEGIFYVTNKINIYVPSKLVNDYKKVFNASNLKVYAIDTRNTTGSAIASGRVWVLIAMLVVALAAVVVVIAKKKKS